MNFIKYFTLVNLFYLLIFFLTIQSSKLQSALTDRVLVVRNLNSPISISIANYYMQKRNVKNVVDIKCNDAAMSANNENITYDEYKINIANPIGNFLSNHPKIDFIVLTKGVPIRIVGAPIGPWGGLYSVDSYLAAMDYDKVLKAQIVDISDINYGADFHGLAYANRYWNSTERFSHSGYGGYLVTRLDGYSESDAKALVDRAILAELKLDTTGKMSNIILLDQCTSYGLTNLSDVPYSATKGQAGKDTIYETHESAYGSFNSDMQLCYNELSKSNIPVQIENSDTFVTYQSNLMGYCSWGSNDVSFQLPIYNSLMFAAGAIGETAVSTSARTFLPTTGGQSLVADLISQGITGMKGYVNEPLLQAIASPTILFNRYTNGWTLAESFYAASNFVGWQDIVLGDPIARAYKILINSVSNCEYADTIVDRNESKLIESITNSLIVQLEHVSEMSIQIQVYDILGELVAEFQIPSGSKEWTINLQGLPIGLYSIQLNNTYKTVIKRSN